MTRPLEDRVDHARRMDEAFEILQRKFGPVAAVRSDPQTGLIRVILDTDPPRVVAEGKTWEDFWRSIYAPTQTAAQTTLGQEGESTGRRATRRVRPSNSRGSRGRNGVGRGPRKRRR